MMAGRAQRMGARQAVQVIQVIKLRVHRVWTGRGGDVTEPRD
jgi:hypothetical protein